MLHIGFPGKWLISGIVLVTFGLVGCAPPGSATSANSCSAGQKTGGGFGETMGKMLSGAVNSYMPAQARPVVSPLNLSSNLPSGFGLIGSRIGCALNTADRQKATEAVQVATVTGKVQTWSGSEPGVSGSARVVQSSGRCRTIQQIVNLSDGTQRTDDVKSCKGPSGWEVVQQ